MGTYFLNDHYVTQGPTGKIFQLAIAGQTGIIEIFYEYKIKL